MTAHPVDIHVGKRLRLRRNMLGLSQEELGKAVGVTFQQIQKYERGSNRISSSRLYEFAKVMSITVGYFFEQLSPDNASGFAEDEEQKDNAQFVPTMERRETMQLVQSYYKIQDPVLRQRMISLMKAMAKEGEMAS